MSNIPEDDDGMLPKIDMHIPLMLSTRSACATGNRLGPLVSVLQVTCLRMLLTSGLESFGHKSTPSDRPWIEAYCPTF